MELDFTGLEKLSHRSPQDELLEGGQGRSTPKQENPAEGLTGAAEGMGKLQREADRRKAEKERSLEVYRAYQSNIKAAGQLQAEILKEIKLNKRKEEKMKKEQVRSFVEKEIWENLVWEGMEAVLYKDGGSWTRQEGLTGTNEPEIIYSVSLSSSYWGESYALDFNEETEKYEKDETMKEDFINDIADEILEEIERESVTA